MIYKEWIWTIRNWTRIAFPLGIAAVFVGPFFLSGVTERSNLYFPLAMVLLFTGFFSQRLEEDLRMQLGAVYLRTPVPPFAQMLTKWAFDSTVGIVAVGLAAGYLASRGQPFTLLELLILVCASSTLTASNMAIVAFVPKLATIVRPLLFVFGLGFGRGAGSGLVTFAIPPLTVFDGLAKVAAGRPSAMFPILLLGQAAVLLAATSFVYRKLLVRNL